MKEDWKEPMANSIKRTKARSVKTESGRQTRAAATEAAAPGRSGAKVRPARSAAAKPAAAPARRKGTATVEVAEKAVKAVKVSKPPKAAKAAKAAKPAASARGKSLVIVESPTKSRTLSKFLGRGYTVMASNGHVMDLPKSQLGVDIENDFEPEYVPIRAKNQALAKIKLAAKDADRIYLAPDPDREGEAIAWHLATALKSARRPLQRLTFNEITERAVKQAIENPRDIDMQLVNAQQARRVLDRLVGYKVSPFVWKTVRYGLSAGRVQSVALRLICEREAAINAFVPEEYWTLEADYETPEAARFTARLIRVGEEELEQGQVRGADAAARAAALAEEIRTGSARVAGVETSPKQVHPKPPFITSTLQQTAYNRFGFTAQRTMKIAQQLYEGVQIGAEGSFGLITYMRTDSPRLAGEAIGEMREWLQITYGEEYVPESPRQFRSKKAAQDAHEAIRPTMVERSPESVRPYLSEEQFKLYDLIWKRAVASQAASAEYLATTVEIESGRLGLRATGRILKFAGFQKLYGLDEEDDADESRLPELTEGVSLTVAKDVAAPTPAAPAVEGAEPTGPLEPVRSLQHFTQPPPRYTEASLVKTLEEENIGRPSTYATIVDTVVRRGYVSREKRALAPTDLGIAVNRLLIDSFPDVFSVGFTAQMEEELDGIEEGAQEWHQVVRDFWGPFSKDLALAEKSAKQHRKRVEEVSTIPCPNDGAMLVKKFGRRGPFYACPNYPKCKYTRPIEEAELPVPVEGTCPECGAGLVARNGPYGRFISCARRPDCKYTRALTLGIKCPDCGQGEIAEKRTRRGKTFYGCTRYPDCKFAAWDKPRMTPCPNCGAPFLVEKETKKGLTLRCLKCKSSFDPDTLGA